MTWTLSTVIAEIFYCIIGLIFIGTGFKALKDNTCSKRVTTAAFWFILAATFIAAPIFPDGSPACALCLWPFSPHLTV